MNEDRFWSTTLGVLVWLIVVPLGALLVVGLGFALWEAIT